MNNIKQTTTATAVVPDALAGLKNATADKNSANPEMKGWLHKWTNYIKGYQRRWFVLSNGVLSYYRNQSEVNHTCRGTISLHGALIHTVDSLTFVISNGGTQTFHIKAANEVERQSWVTSLELAKAKAIRAMENEEQEEEETEKVIPAQEINTVVRELSERLENLRTCYDLITKHGVALQRALTDLESNDEESLASRTKIVNERATLFRITSNAMINACNDYLRTAETQGHKWSKMVQHEREQRQRLEEIVEQLAKQHTQLERAAELGQVKLTNHDLSPMQPTTTSNLTSDDETEFFDAEETTCCNAIDDKNLQKRMDHAFIMQLPKIKANNSNYNTQGGSSSESEETKSIAEAATNASNRPTLLVISNTMGNPNQDQEQNEDQAVPQVQQMNQVNQVSREALVETPSNIVARQALEKSSGAAYKHRRTRVPDKPNHPVNLWSIMKNCIGKELSKIPMPVNFSEPLSMLQRLTEDYEYSELLDAAAQATDECEQLAYIAAFTVSSYSSTAYRTAKPFNPLLGETYECDRMDDLGWRSMAEQVSHHPPIAAIHCEGRRWKCWQEFTMTSKFRGKYLQVIPLGSAFVEFADTGNKYTWRKVTTTVNNIIVGKLWVDQTGEMEINGLAASKGIKCVLKYVPYAYFNRDQQRQVKGVVMDRQGVVKWVIQGTWHEQLRIAPVLSTSGSADAPVYQTGPYKTIWVHRPPPPGSEAYYNFSQFTSALNEPEEGVAPTDSRLRPDQRLMEEGNWNESNKEKLRLEEKQRRKRRQFEKEVEQAAASGSPLSSYEALWFERQQDVDSDIYLHVFKGTYWDHKKRQDWSQCPDLF